jgi:hypothetical protein
MHRQVFHGVNISVSILYPATKISNMFPAWTGNEPIIYSLQSLCGVQFLQPFILSESLPSLEDNMFRPRHALARLYATWEVTKTSPFGHQSMVTWP